MCVGVSNLESDPLSDLVLQSNFQHLGNHQRRNAGLEKREHDLQLAHEANPASAIPRCTFPDSNRVQKQVQSKGFLPQPGTQGKSHPTRQSDQIYGQKAKKWIVSLWAKKWIVFSVGVHCVCVCDI